MKKILFFLSLFVALLITSCYTPSPLYGTWSCKDQYQNDNSIKFLDTMEYLAKISNSAGIVESYSGKWAVIDNVLVFTDEETSKTRETEWDIRGAILYLTWDGKELQLYHTAK